MTQFKTFQAVLVQWTTHLPDPVVLNMRSGLRVSGFLQFSNFHFITTIIPVIAFYALYFVGLLKKNVGTFWEENVQTIVPLLRIANLQIVKIFWV